MDSTNYVYTSSYDAYEYFFKGYVSVSGLRIGNKRAGTHLFRHNRMKQMYLNGDSMEVIKNHFGLSSIQTVSGYVNSVVEKLVI